MVSNSKEMSEGEQRYYVKTFERILQHLETNPFDLTTWIARKFLAGDKRKALEILKHLESQGKIVSEKNALNHYMWALTKDKMV